MPREHPSPTAATVKELYANAFSCAYPECNLPLFRVNPDKTRTLNSRIAHICARRENGPRWDPEMSPEANRSVANLLLLCIEHAYEIDDDERVRLYPKDLLRTWKAEQLAEFDRVRQGWPLTDAEANKVIHESLAAEIIIQGETINLGGSGGQAPGAGGSGGSAIGHGATGGKGGPGGPITINLGGTSGTDPGTGGGGAGNVHPESELLWRGPGKTPTLGLYKYLGADAPDGGDTIFATLRACGGEGARAGSGIRSASSTLAVSSLVLANSVELHGPYFCLLSGGFSHYNVLNLNDSLAMLGLVVLEAGGVQEGEYGVAIHAVRPEGDVAESVRPVFNITRHGDILRISIWFSLNVQVAAYVMWAVVVQHEGRTLAQLPIAIQQGISRQTTMLPEE